MKHFSVLAAAAALTSCVLAAPAAVRADTLFTTQLTGAQETPPVVTPATGFGSLLLNDAETQAQITLTWADLTAPAAAAHIHGPALPGNAAGILFHIPVTETTTGQSMTTWDNLTTEQVGWLKGGLLYFNVHTSTYPAGEIRGQIPAIPEPGTLALAASLLPVAGVAGVRRRRASRNG
jgi:hypothetical protein